jgi:hypothetical protein
MRTNRTPDEWADWCIAKNQIAEVLKEYYQACMTGELPPQLLTLLKKLDDGSPQGGDQTLAGAREEAS